MATKITVEKAPSAPQAAAGKGRKRASKADATAPASTEVRIDAPTEAEAQVRESVEQTVLNMMAAIQKATVSLFDGCVANILAQLDQQAAAGGGVPRAVTDAAARRSQAKMLTIHDARTGETVQIEAPGPDHRIVIR